MRIRASRWREPLLPRYMEGASEYIRCTKVLEAEVVGVSCYATVITRHRAYGSNLVVLVNSTHSDHIKLSPSRMGATCRNDYAGCGAVSLVGANAHVVASKDWKSL